MIIYVNIGEGKKIVYIEGSKNMSTRYPAYYKDLANIEIRVRKYEETSRQMKQIQQELHQIKNNGFDMEITEIKNKITDLHAHGKVNQLMKILNEKIENYQIESELIEEEFNQLPLDMVDEDKFTEMKQLSLNPKTIHQAWKWIRNIQKYIDQRNRICFPKELTQYSDEYLIGTGGFSRVYKVKNRKKNKIVAVKIPIKNDESIGKSFLKELNNWVSLDHKNIVKIFHYNILPVLYIEMEYCDCCLDDIEKPVQYNRALYYTHEIALGLEFAHKHNIAHLDLKPQNILLKNDTPKITDWGLSRLLTNPGTTTLGISLPFAAPEQFSTKFGNKDNQTDIWQIGILLYYLLTNKFPFTGTDFAEYSQKVTTLDIKDVIKNDSSIQEVTPILIKCLARQKKNRYKTIKEFIKDLEKKI